ncbi:T9SS type A sorting domain-containing protein [bacterium]|nr:T9SS type A sorting domain-containing protein [bacterium]
MKSAKLLKPITTQNHFLVTLCIFFSFVFCKAGDNQNFSPLPDFKLEEQELFIAFGSGTSSNAPFLQYIDHRWIEGTEEYEYWTSPLFETMDAASHQNVRATAVLLSEKQSIVLGTLQTDNSGNFYRIENDDNQLDISSMSNLNTIVSGSDLRYMFGGCFSAAARAQNLQQLLIAAGDKWWGYWKNNKVDEIDQCYGIKNSQAIFGIPGSHAFEIADLDGDNIDELIGVVIDMVALKVYSYKWNVFPGTPVEKLIFNKSSFGFTNADLACGDIDHDGRSEIVIFFSMSDRDFYAMILDYNSELEQWEQVSYAGNDNPMNNTLLDSDHRMSLSGASGPYKLDVDMMDIDYNGYCDIVFAMSANQNGDQKLFNWIYTFDLDGIQNPKERLASVRSNAGLDVSMTIANAAGDENFQVYCVTNRPALYIINYIKENDEFIMQEPMTSNFTTNYGFEKPIIVASDINNDSFWCRFFTSKFDSVNSLPGVGKPVAIITAPPCEKGINDDSLRTYIKVIYAEAHDTLCSVQASSGFGYSYNIETSLDISKLTGIKKLKKLPKLKQGFEQVYIDTVESRSSFRKGYFESTGWTLNNKTNSVLWLNSGYYQYPYRIEYLDGTPVLGEDNEEMWFYILLPRNPTLQFDPWETYIEEYELMYGNTARSALENFMEPFMRHTPGNVYSYYGSNMDPEILDYLHAFPTLTQELNSAITSFEKAWGRSTYRSIEANRSRYWSFKFSVKGGFTWKSIGIDAQVKTHQFTHVRENHLNENEDMTVIELHSLGVPAGKEYTFESDIFWGTEEAGIPGALILTHRVTEISPYYGTTNIEDHQTVTDIPENFELNQNIPNPFNPITKIHFELPKNEQVCLIVYNTLGQQVKNLISDNFEAGYHTVTWNGLNDQENAVAAGIYICRILAGDYQKAVRMVLMK